MSNTQNSLGMKKQKAIWPITRKKIVNIIINNRDNRQEFKVTFTNIFRELKKSEHNENEIWKEPNRTSRSENILPEIKIILINLSMKAL